MTNSTIAIDEPATIDKRLDTEELAVGVNTVQRERVQVSGATDVAIATVGNSAPSTTEQGLTVRDPNTNRTSSGTLNALNAAVTITCEGARSITWEIDTGTLVGTVVFEATLDDTNWFAINAIRVDGTIISSTATFPDRGALTTVGYSQVRLRVSAFTSGSSASRVEHSQGGEVVRISQALPVGSNVIGKVKIRNPGDTVDLGDATNPVRTDPTGTTIQPVSGTVSVTEPVTVDAIDLDIRNLTAANDTVVANAGTGNFNVVGTQLDNSANSSAKLPTIPAKATAATPLWTEGFQAPLSVNTVGSLRITVMDTPEVHGTVAHDSVDSGKPVKIGHVGRTINPTAVIDGDRVNSFADDVGRQVVVPNQVRDLVTRQTTTITVSTEQTILTAGAAGVFHDLTLLTVSNTSATDVRVDFRDATAGTIQFSLFVKAGAVVGFSLTTPMTQTAAANNWTAQSSAAVTDLRILVQAVKNV